MKWALLMYQTDVINFDTLDEQQMDIQGLRDFVLNHCLKDD